MTPMAYDTNNIFARILRGEIPCKKVYEDAHSLAFEDINPQAPIHTLVIPKGSYVSMTEFVAHASEAEMASLNRTILRVVEIKGLAANGYRLLVNSGLNGGQEVPHLHYHVLGGRPLGPMLARQL
jgi:histidine triad (HIT) family protein